MNHLLRDLRRLLRSLASFSFFINLLYLASAIFMLQVFDRVIPSQSTDTLLVLMLGTGIALVFLLLLDYLRGRLQGMVGNLVDERLSPPVVNAVVEQAARAADGVRSDPIRDVNVLRSVFSAAGLIAMFDAPWLVIYVAVIFAFHPLLGIGAALFALAMVALAWLNDRLTRAPIEEVQRRARKAHQFVEGSLRNAEVLQALGMTKNLIFRWQRLQDQVADVQEETSKKTVAFTSATKFMRQAIQVVMLSLGAYLVLTQQASAGIMIATTILVGRALQPVEQLVGSWRSLTEGRVAFQRLSALLKDIDNQPVLMDLPAPQGLISVEGVSYRAATSDRVILFNLTFDLQPGEALAMIGPSAAGKSTLARLITGVWRPSAGVIRLDGADIAQWPREEIGPWIGYEPQDVELFDGTVADNIARLGKVDSKAVVAAAKRANAHDMILALANGYDTPVGEQGSQLSPGQRQRIALARALYGDPRLVVLDEPNSNLDGAGEIALAQALSALKQARITTVVVTHRPALIAHVDKILVLDGGKILQFGPAEDVMKWMRRNGQVAVMAEKAA